MEKELSADFEALPHSVRVSSGGFPSETYSIEPNSVLSPQLLLLGIGHYLFVQADNVFVGLVLPMGVCIMPYL